MQQNDFANDIRIQDLGVGAGMALWAFRACAMGHGECATIKAGYHRAFGAMSDAVLSDVRDYARLLGNDGRRRIALGCSG
ncbi:MAG: hypothetical protein AAGJ87_16795, partial [Pseudomonadota bacterium]